MDIKIENIDSNKNCRVCLDVYTDMIPLFGSKNIISYSDMLVQCSKVNVEENDGLPTVICQSCAEKMVQAFDFVNKCQETDKQLRLYLQKKCIENIDLKDLISIKEEPSYPASDCSIDEFISPVDCKKTEKVKKWKTKKMKRKGDKANRKDKHKSLPLKCEECGLLVRSKSAMIIHAATHSEERPYQCDDCGKSYRSRGNLRKHIVSAHSGEEGRRYRCADCSKAFHCRSELVVHSRSHTGDTPYQCQWCPKAFTQLSALSRHRLIHTGERPFQCATCGKNFSTRDNLKNHMVVHTTEKKFSCKICGCLLKTRGSLAKHQLLHTDVKAFVCDQCGRPFRTKGNLKLHMDKKHSEKSGYCTICSKRFSDIEEHNNIHTGSTPFQCTMCNNKYGVKRSLLVHMRKHDNQEKYSCDYEGCSKKFPIKCMLDFHVLKYHKKQTPYVCQFCNRGFFRLNDLNLHKKMNHMCMEIVKKNVPEDNKP